MVNGIEITEVVVYPIKKPLEGTYVRAFARVTLNNSLVLNGLRIIKGKTGYFIGFPQEYNKTERRGYDITYPITLEMRTYIQQMVLQLWTPAKEEV